MTVCLFICPLAYLKNYMSKFHQIFCICYLWQWLSPELTEVYKLCTSGFVDDVMVLYNRANGRESKTTHMFCPVRQVAAPEAKCSIPDCILLLFLFNYSLMILLFTPAGKDPKG